MPFQRGSKCIKAFSHFNPMRIMFEKVLLPLDFSEQSMMMFECVLELKRFGSKEVVLLYVTGKGEEATPEQRATLESLVSHLREGGMEARVVHKEGEPVATILEVAEQEGVNMISMASSGKGKAREFLVGSTSFGVLRGTKRPVLVDKFKVVEKGGARLVKRSCTTIFRRALVPVDFSPCTKKIVDMIPKLCTVGMSEAVLFHVVESTRYDVDDGERFTKVLEDLNKLRDRLASQGCNVTTHIHFGTVSYNILEAARELDASMILLGTRGKSLLREVALGSNSEEVARKAQIPILMVPC